MKVPTLITEVRKSFLRKKISGAPGARSMANIHVKFKNVGDFLKKACKYGMGIKIVWVYLKFPKLITEDFIKFFEKKYLIFPGATSMG